MTGETYFFTYCVCIIWKHNLCKQTYVQFRTNADQTSNQRLSYLFQFVYCRLFFFFLKYKLTFLCQKSTGYSYPMSDVCLHEACTDLLFRFIIYWQGIRFCLTSFDDSSRHSRNILVDLKRIFRTAIRKLYSSKRKNWKSASNCLTAYFPATTGI